MINLIPPREKANRKQEKDFKLVLIVGFLVLAVLVVIVLSFLSIKFYIYNQITYLKTTIDQKEQEVSYTKNLDRKLSDINNILHEFNNFYKEQFAVSDFLAETSNWLTTDISLETFSYKEENSEVGISGNSKSLEDVHSFRETLRSQERVSSLSFSLDNWLETKETRFRAIFNIEK